MSNYKTFVIRVIEKLKKLEFVLCTLLVATSVYSNTKINEVFITKAMTYY